MDAELYNALQQIVAEGKKPTLALLKNRTAGMPLPQLIDALKRFSANPDNIQVSAHQRQQSAASPIEQIQQQMAQMAQQIELLQQQVSELQQQLAKSIE
ncbi:hypothetical protein [Ferrimonas senticii]|uniref:hypothetical protein n=1 Tax=Ferrimonas senticii TaxID=394566 RepID=UPI0003FDE9B5|nr:hypothetical protein [Ferrimonas senticii]